MPSRPRKPCSTPGCPQTVTSGRCEKHTQQAEAQRGTAAERGYGTRWERRKRAYIYRHPWCNLCGRPAQVPDHHPETRKELVAKGDPDPDADRHLRPLCTSCHNSETARNQPGGWNAR